MLRRSPFVTEAVVFQDLDTHRAVPDRPRPLVSDLVDLPVIDGQGVAGVAETDESLFAGVPDQGLEDLRRRRLNVEPVECEHCEGDHLVHWEPPVCALVRQ